MPEREKGWLLEECRLGIEERSWWLWRFQDMAVCCAIYSDSVPRRNGKSRAVGGVRIRFRGGAMMFFEVKEKMCRRKAPEWPHDVRDTWEPMVTCPAGFSHPRRKALMDLILEHWIRCDHRIELDIQKHEYPAVALDCEPRMMEEFHEWRDIRPELGEAQGARGELQLGELRRWGDFPGADEEAEGDPDHGLGRWPGGERAPCKRVRGAELLCGRARPRQAHQVRFSTRVAKEVAGDGPGEGGGPG